MCVWVCACVYNNAINRFWCVCACSMLKNAIDQMRCGVCVCNKAVDRTRCGVLVSV